MFGECDVYEKFAATKPIFGVEYCNAYAVRPGAWVAWGGVCAVAVSHLGAGVPCEQPMPYCCQHACIPSSCVAAAALVPA